MYKIRETNSIFKELVWVVAKQEIVMGIITHDINNKAYFRMSNQYNSVDSEQLNEIAKTLSEYQTKLEKDLNDAINKQDEELNNLSSN